MKKIFLLIFTILSQLAFGQNQIITYQKSDSITLLKTKWEKHRIAPKTKLFIHHFNQKNLFSSNQQISYIEVKNKTKAPIFAIGNEIKEKKTTSTFGKEQNAIAAINGTFFDVANGGSVDFIKLNGIILKTNVLDKNGNRARHQKAAIVIENGKLGLKKWDNLPNWENDLKENDVMLSGPLLLFNNQVEELDTAAFNRLRHPRSALGIKANGNVILITIDGRQEQSAGMSLFELTKLMRWLGCISAINLDGGGSTTLWVSSFAGSGVVNYPSDNKIWDHDGERKVANVIFLKKKQ